MWVERLFLRNFRNYERLDMEASPGLNYLYGHNGAGKTNILEALFTLSRGESPRTSRRSELVRWGSDHFYLKAKLHRRDQVVNLEFYQDRGGKRACKLNGRTLSSLSDLLGTMQVVLFTPGDLSLVKDGPAARREYVDAELSQLDPLYYQRLNQYQQVLRQRNNLLKEYPFQPDMPLLDTWDEQLLPLAADLVHRRGRWLAQLAARAAAHYAQVGQDAELAVRYQPSGWDEAWQLEDQDEEQPLEELQAVLADAIAASREADLERGFTTVGPHRDQVDFLLGDHDSRYFGSQGQQRTVVLAVKLAELELVSEYTGQTPVLLLDDVLSELDTQRAARLLKQAAVPVQTWLTSTGRDDLSENGLMLDEAWTFKVEEGQLYRQ